MKYEGFSNPEMSLAYFSRLVFLAQGSVLVKYKTGVWSVGQTNLLWLYP